MKTLHASRGPFAERPFYKDEEIESICTDELRAVKLLPGTPEAIRIDRFIEKRFKVVPEYRDLGQDILGLTEFGPKGVRAVIVARALEDEGTEVAERRIRSTLAHEGGHGLLHAHLFALGVQPPLFADVGDPEKPKVLCRGEGGGHKAATYTGEWWEFQANRAMGALLMPKRLVEVGVQRFLVAVGSLGLRSLDRSRVEEVVKVLAGVFAVNPAMVRIRLSTLYPQTSSSQLQL